MGEARIHRAPGRKILDKLQAPVRPAGSPPNWLLIQLAREDWGFTFTWPPSPDRRTAKQPMAGVSVCRCISGKKVATIGAKSGQGWEEALPGAAASSCPSREPVAWPERVFGAAGCRRREAAVYVGWVKVGGRRALMFGRAAAGAEQFGNGHQCEVTVAAARRLTLPLQLPLAPITARQWGIFAVRPGGSALPEPFARCDRGCERTPCSRPPVACVRRVGWQTSKSAPSLTMASKSGFCSRCPATGT